MHAACCPRLRNPAANPGLSSLNLSQKVLSPHPAPHGTPPTARSSTRVSVAVCRKGTRQSCGPKRPQFAFQSCLRAARGSGAGTGKRTASDWLRFAVFPPALAIEPGLDIRSHPQQFSSHELVPLQPCTLVTVSITVVQKRWPVAHPPVGGSGPRNDHRQA